MGLNEGILRVICSFKVCIGAAVITIVGGVVVDEPDADEDKGGGCEFDGAELPYSDPYGYDGGREGLEIIVDADNGRFKTALCVGERKVGYAGGKNDDVGQGGIIGGGQQPGIDADYFRDAEGNICQR